MIPKRVFYVWVGGQKSRLVNVCIENWRMILPDYEIIEVGEKSKDWFDFDREYQECLWFRTVYDLKMWAYVADYIRFKVLYDHGGVYFDTDVTLYKSLNEFLPKKMFLGSNFINLSDVALIGAEKNHPYLKDLVEFYQKRIWESSVYVIGWIFKEVVSDKYGLMISPQENFENEMISVYKPEYFNPHQYWQEFSHNMITPNTYAVHWQNGSWMNKKNLYFLKNKHRMPLKILLKQLDFIERVDAHAHDKTNIDRLIDNGNKLI